jgi:hypothetical protein
MNTSERQEAYRVVKERYNLWARQRDVLDAYPKLPKLLQLAHEGRWHYVNVMLEESGALDIDGPTVINIHGANYGAINM